MKKSVLVGIMAIWVLLLICSLGFAATLTVCSSGCGYTSIQAAVDAANPGDTITVAAGYYYEGVNVYKPGLIIQGADRLKTFIWSRGDGINITAPLVQISGFTVQGDPGNVAIFVNGLGGGTGAPAKKTPLRNAPAADVGAYKVTISDCIAEKSGIGIAVVNSSEVMIKSCHARNNSSWYEGCFSGIGIAIIGEDIYAPNTKVINCMAYDNDSYGIYLNNCTNWNCYDSAVREEFPQSHNEEECIDYFDGMIVQNNTLFNNGAWDLYAPYDQNSLGFYAHTHGSRIAFIGNKILATSGDGQKVSSTATTADGFGGSEFEYCCTAFKCWQWAGNVVFRELYPVLRGVVNKMERPSGELD